MSKAVQVYMGGWGGNIASSGYRSSGEAPSPHHGHAILCLTQDPTKPIQGYPQQLVQQGRGPEARTG